MPARVRSGVSRSGPSLRRERASPFRPQPTVPSPSIDLSGPVTFLLGAERDGLPSTVERDLDARIPIESAESLNVAAAGAIALYEWLRQIQTESSPPSHGVRSNQP